MAWLITALIWLYVAGIFSTIVLAAEMVGTLSKPRVALFVLLWPLSVPAAFLAAVIS